MLEGLVVVIPTRNRAALAVNAIRSVLDQTDPRVHVLVSDNSTDEAEITRLSEFCKGPVGGQVRYISPAEQCAMSKHWDWVLLRAFEVEGASHVLYLTDRTILKAGELAPLLRVVERHPDAVLIFNEDRVEDASTPVRLVQSRWTGHLVEVTADRLLMMSSRMRLTPLPRLMNCVVPRRVATAVRERFGTVCDSVSPDFCFAYRSLSVEDSVLYFDRASVINYAQARSNGASVSRGEVTKDNADFMANLPMPLNAHAPVPGFRTVRNAIIHEYCLTQKLTGGRKFPEVDRDQYLREMEREIAQMQESPFRGQMEALLREQGAFGGKTAPISLIQNILRLLVTPVTRPLWELLNRSVNLYPPGDAPLLFDTTEQALEHANRRPRRRHLISLHLNVLLGEFRRLE